MNEAGNGAPAHGATEIAYKQEQSEYAMMDGLSSSKVTGIPTKALPTMLTHEILMNCSGIP
jgi:hypothetical protein